MKIKGYAKFGGGRGVGGGEGANKVHYEKPSRCPRRCCLSSAISTVDNGTLIRESDSKAT